MFLCSNAWMAQRGKSTDQCQLEYVALMITYDPQFREIAHQLYTGKIKKIKVSDTAQSSGGVLAKAVPRPKAEDSSHYLS